MTESYAERLRAALAPQTEDEHRTADYLAAVTKLQADTLLGMIERRLRTTARAARIRVAQVALDGWLPEPTAPPDAYAVMEAYARGADPAAGTVPEPDEDPATAIGLAYDHGWNEAVAYCREQQERGLDPKLWAAEPHADGR